ncbi:unnamed protein product [Adineta ricciae]|uniref:RING-type domain-containing protein n=1 Tax=Adineta ricciae TaxID=249248 RepID=A0A815IF86_ADIRI|nr:unnamed protein product [Adineta ricciae]
MTVPFSDYRLLPVEDIILANVRVDHIPEDLTSLFGALTPLYLIFSRGATDGIRLSQTIVSDLKKKTNTLCLLEYVGYRCETDDHYVYRSETSYLKAAKSEPVDNLKEFLQKHSSQYRTTSSVRTPLTADEIERENKNALEMFQSFKKSLVTPYNSSPSSGFIRRQLAILVLKQLSSNLDCTTDDIDGKLDQYIIELKNRQQPTRECRADEVYIECLIRSNFDINRAVGMLNHYPPNLTPRTEQPIPQEPVEVFSKDAKVYLSKYSGWSTTSFDTNNNKIQASLEQDKWNDIEYLLLAIQHLHQKNDEKSVDEEFVSKMFRLIHSELSHLIGDQVPVKLETLARILCERSGEVIENLDVETLKNILTSVEFNDNFIQNTIACLEFTCSMCTGSYPRTKIEAMLLCEHSFCFDCVKRYYRVKIFEITDENSLKMFTCVETPVEIASDRRSNFLPCLFSKINQWFKDDPEALRKWERDSLIALAGERIKKCGSSKCTGYYYSDNDDTVGVARCQECNFAQCRLCAKKWHAEHSTMNCDEYTEWLIENDPDDETVRALKIISDTAIVCPKCEHIYQYEAGGCEHYTCLTCKTDFCRMCSTLFYSPSKEPKCNKENCTLKSTIHAHCAWNCFRETRIAEIQTIHKVLEDQEVDIDAELEKIAETQQEKCPISGCDKKTSPISGGRLCEVCYKHFLCSLIWRFQIEPWDIYEDNNLQQMLTKSSVTIPTDCNRNNLIALCKDKLKQLLGKPKKLKKPKPHRTCSLNSCELRDQDQMTLNIISKLKARIQRHQRIDRSTIESEVVDIKYEMDPHRYDINQWRKQLSLNMSNCPDRILRESMAYSDDPHKAQSIIAKKSNETNSNRNPVESSLNNLTDYLTTLRDDLKANPLTDLFSTVYNVNDSDSDRINRLFLSEALHFCPALSHYTCNEAHAAVQGIRAVNYHLNEPDDLLAILKTCHSSDEVRQYLEQRLSKSIDHSHLSTYSTSQSFDYHRPNHYNSPNNVD